MSGANGSLHGLNLYVYCFNNPINMTDSQGDWPTWNEFWNEAKRIVIGVLEAYVKAVEYEIGIGQGLGADAQSAALTGYRNTYISFDNGEFTAGNKFLTSIKIAGFGISYEANHKTYAGGKTLKTSAHNSDGPLAMLNYSETEKAHVISFSILDINLKNGELKYTTGSSAHILFGVHYSAGFSITEFIRGVIDIWK